MELGGSPWAAASPRAASPASPGGIMVPRRTASLSPEANNDVKEFLDAFGD